MAKRPQYLVSVGYHDLAVGSLTDATALVRLLSKMQLVRRVYDDGMARGGPVYEMLDEPVQMQAITLRPRQTDDVQVSREQETLVDQGRMLPSRDLRMLPARADG